MRTPSELVRYRSSAVANIGGSEDVGCLGLHAA